MMMFDATGSNELRHIGRIGCLRAQAQNHRGPTDCAKVHAKKKRAGKRPPSSARPAAR
jgi:hypothetical protein